MDPMRAFFPFREGGLWPLRRKQNPRRRKRNRDPNHFQFFHQARHFSLAGLVLLWAILIRDGWNTGHGKMIDLCLPLLVQSAMQPLLSLISHLRIGDRISWFQAGSAGDDRTRKLPDALVISADKFIEELLLFLDTSFQLLILLSEFVIINTQDKSKVIKHQQLIFSIAV